MEERRRHPRIEVSCPVAFSTDRFPDPKSASTLDLSLGGTRIETRSSVLKDEVLDMAIHVLPEAIRCRGRVMYAFGSNGGMSAGIHFEEMSDHERFFLGECLSYIMEQATTPFKGIMLGVILGILAWAGIIFAILKFS